VGSLQLAAGKEQKQKKIITQSRRGRREKQKRF